MNFVVTLVALVKFTCYSPAARPALYIYFFALSSVSAPVVGEEVHGETSQRYTACFVGEAISCTMPFGMYGDVKKASVFAAINTSSRFLLTA